MYSKYKQANYKLTYFNGRGRAETTRMCLSIGGIRFEDVRIKQEDWPALKPETPWGTLPVLEVDGKKFGQSKAVARIAARAAGLDGKTDADAAVADAIVDTVSDMQDKMYGVFFAPDEEKPAKIKALEDVMIATMPSLEKILISNRDGNGYFIGDKLTWADLHFYQFVENVLVLEVKSLDWNPKLAALYKRIGEHPKIVDYLRIRPKTQF